MKYQLDRLKTLLLALGILFVGLIFTFFKFFNVLQPPQDYSYEAGETITGNPGQEMLKITINFGNSNYANYEFSFTNGATPYSLLQQAASQNGFNVISQAGPFVTSIDGISGDNQFFWGYYVNGQMGGVASDQYQLLPGDKVEWKYEAIQQ